MYLDLNLISFIKRISLWVSFLWLAYILANNRYLQETFRIWSFGSTQYTNIVMDLVPYFDWWNFERDTFLKFENPPSGSKVIIFCYRPMYFICQKRDF